MTTPTERRLAITPGTWQVRLNKHDECEVHSDNGEWIAVVPHQCVTALVPTQEANAELIADAGTTYNACHLTPSELLAKLREAQDVVVHMVSAAKYHFKHGNDTNLDKQTDIADAFLSNLNLPK